jgi:hypothetical protein
MHDIEIISKVGLCRWLCNTCGAFSNRWYLSEEEAIKAANRHCKKK